MFDKKTKHVASERVFVVGRLKNLFKPNSPEIKTTEKIHKKKEQDPKSIVYRPANGLVIDTNGKAYLTDSFGNIPTDITLNISNKDKISPVLFGMVNKTITAKEIVKEMQSFKAKSLFFLRGLKFLLRHKLKNLKVTKFIQSLR